MVTPETRPLGHLTNLGGRSVLVTGHSGFIGSRLYTLFVAAGTRVVGSDFPEQQVSQLDGSKAARLLSWGFYLDLGDTSSWTVPWARMGDGELNPADAMYRQVRELLVSLAWVRQ